MLWHFFPTLMLLPQWVLAFAKVSGHIKWRNLDLNFFSNCETNSCCFPSFFLCSGVFLGYFGGEIESWRVKVKVEVAQSYPPLCHPTGCTVHGIVQARILQWIAIPFSRGSSQPRNWTRVSHTAGRFFTSWATREAPLREMEENQRCCSSGRRSLAPECWGSCGLRFMWCEHSFHRLLVTSLRKEVLWVTTTSWHPGGAHTVKGIPQSGWEPVQTDSTSTSHPQRFCICRKVRTSALSCRPVKEGYIPQRSS